MLSGVILGLSRVQGGWESEDLEGSVGSRPIEGN